MFQNNIKCYKMDNKPLVSIVIPSYNSASVVGDAIKSSCGQSYKNVEVIVVDDGSSDNTEDVLDTLKNDFNLKIVTKKMED